MSAAVNVLNWNELIALLKDQINVVINGDLNIDFSSVSEVLEKYFPDIIELLRAILDHNKKLEGIQKMKGYHQKVIENKEYEVLFTPNEDVMLTGITYAQSLYQCEDKFDLVVINDLGEEIKLFDNLYVKDCMQHKLFQVFFPVPRACRVKLIMYNESSSAKDIWVDFEYLSVKSLDKTEGTVITRYLTKGDTDFTLLAEETLSLDLGVHHIDNTKEFEGLTKLEPTSKLITLTAENPTRIVEFFYKKEELNIGHPYDIKVALRWENDTSVDLDLYGFIDKDSNRFVSYRKKEHFETERDKLWLDHDFVSHGPNGYDKEPEILTLLGFETSVLSIQVQNYNGRELRENIIVEVSRVDGTLLSTHTINRNLLNQGSTRNIYVCDIEIASKVVIERNKPIGSVGEF